MNKIQSFNPANGSLVWEGEITSKEEIQNKVFLAKQAFNTWSKTSLEERICFLENYGKKLSTMQDTLAEFISREMGKPLWDSKTEVAAMIGKIPLSIKAYKERCAAQKTQLENQTLTTCFHPHGVITVFGPYNFPAHLPNGHIVPALLAGNTVIFKPSEQTPYIGELIKNAFDQAELPDGVFQVVQGGKEIGKNLAASDIQGIFFTGSSKTGKLLLEQNINKPETILALEMGGNNPLVVSAISDIDAAIYTTIQSAFLTTGQRCSAARRLILTEKCPKKAFLDALIAKTNSLIIGAHDDPITPFMGPLIDLKTADYLIQVQDELIKKGAKPLSLMQKLKSDLPFVTPAILDVTSLDCKDEEYFGPFLQVIEVDSLEMAIQVANQTQYGLTAGLLSESEEEWHACYQEIKAGIINWNTPLTGASSKAPFGGIGKSGNFRPSAYFAADYCSYPVASMITPHLHPPKSITPGIPS